MTTTSNRFAGPCKACGKHVPAGAGILEAGLRRGWSHYALWCKSCFDKSDNSGDEDRCCGNRAYEDACAERCGF